MTAEAPRIELSDPDDDIAFQVSSLLLVTTMSFVPRFSPPRERRGSI